MTTRADKDRIKGAIGAERKAITKLADSLVEHLDACHTDYMKARTVEAFCDRYHEIKGRKE